MTKLKYKPGTKLKCIDTNEDFYKQFIGYFYKDGIFTVDKPVGNTYAFVEFKGKELHGGWSAGGFVEDLDRMSPLSTWKDIIGG